MDLAVDMLAAARITRLVTTDTFPPVKRAREALLKRVDPRGVRKIKGAEPPALAELIECNWCAGFWISTAVVAARWRFPRLWGAVAPVWATSMVVGLVAGVSEREGDLSDLGRTLDGVGLFVGRSIEGAGRAVAEASVPVELTALVDSAEVPDREHYVGRFGEAAGVMRESPRTMDQFREDNKGKQE